MVQARISDTGSTGKKKLRLCCPRSHEASVFKRGSYPAEAVVVHVRSTNASLHPLHSLVIFIFVARHTFIVSFYVMAYHCRDHWCSLARLGMSSTESFISRAVFRFWIPTTSTLGFLDLSPHLKTQVLLSACAIIILYPTWKMSFTMRNIPRQEYRSVEISLKPPKMSLCPGLNTPD